MREAFYRLILVTNKGNAATKPYLKFIETCIKGGITSVQLREKLPTHKDLLEFGSVLKSLLDFHNVPLMINDDVSLCLELDAAGVHLGQSDLEVEKARAVLGPQKIIGLSANSLEQIEKANAQPINYIGIGAIFPTKSKSDVTTIWGLDRLKQASLLSSHPLVAIGGIEEENAQAVIHAGADGIAAIAAFHKAKAPLLTAKNLLKIIQEENHDR